MYKLSGSGMERILYPFFLDTVTEQYATYMYRRLKLAAKKIWSLYL